MIKLTKIIDNKKVELDVISLNGKATIRQNCFKKLSKRGITKTDLGDAGFEVESAAKV
jgi:hypothetical protein